MRIIYIHGLDSSANSMKGLLLEQYCNSHHSEIEVIRPDLNQSPNRVFKGLCELVNSEAGTASNSKQILLMGSSLGGYFASLVSNETGYPAILLNPSTKPHISLQRFVDGTTTTNHTNNDKTNPANNNQQDVVYKTTGGWGITLADLDWFDRHKLEQIVYPEKVFVIIKKGDELLDPIIATNFYRSQGAQVDLQPGGDHRMTDFEHQLPMIMKHILSVR